MLPFSSVFRLIALLGMWGMLAACQPDSASQSAAAADPAASTAATRASVMQHHDALMGRMDALTTERQRLQQLPILDSTSAVGRRRVRAIRRHVRALQQADAAMIDWMHRYREPDTTRLSAHQYQDFWADQAQQLRRLEQQMSAALDSAQQLR